MTTDRRHPFLRTVLGAQLRLVARRRLAVAGATLLVAATIVVLSDGVLGRRPITLSGGAAGFWSWGTLIPLLWPFVVTWKGEGPSARAYHWTLPVGRGAHQLLRCAAGWLLLVGVLAAGLLSGWLGGALAQGGMGSGDPLVLATLLPAATVLYLVAAVFALLLERPLLWLFVSWVGLGSTAVLRAFEGWEWIPDAVDAAIMYGSHSLAAAAVAPRSIAGLTGGGVDAGSPWSALLLWLLVAGAAAALAARVHRERSGEG